MKKVILLFMFSFLFSQTVWAVTPNNMLTEQLDMINAGEFDKVSAPIKQNSENEILRQFDLKDFAYKFITGQIDLSMTTIFNFIAVNIFNELRAFFSLMQKLIMIGILSAVLKNLSESFQNKSTGELGFFVCYMVLVIILLDSFRIGIMIVRDTINQMTDVMQALLPLFVTLLFSSGQVAQATAITPLIISVIQVISVFVRDIVVSVTAAAAMLQIINYISERDALHKLSDLIQYGISWSIKGAAFIFIGVAGLQKAGGPALNKVVGKSAKAAVNAVPVVGEILTGAVDTVLSWSSLVKNSVAIGSIVFLVLLCAFPVFKIIALLVAYKLTAAVIQPVCEERIVKCIDSVGTYTAILLGALVLVAVMFMTATVILISTVT